MRDHRLRSLALCLLGVLPLGCQGWDWRRMGASPVQQEAQSPEVAKSILGSSDSRGLTDESAQAPAPPPIQIQLQFDVVKVELPAVDARQSAKVWDHVDEMRQSADLAATLMRNGVRVGVSTDDSWQALSALFAQEGAGVNRTQAAIEPGVPLWLGLGGFDPGESLFLFPPESAMLGYTFEGGSKCFRVDYEVMPTDPPEISLRLTPEVHMQEGPPRWVSTGREYQLARSAEMHVFQGLITDWVLKEGEFLVLGPDNTSSLEQRVGERFLTGRFQGSRADIILCVKPRLFRVSGAKK